MHTCVYIYIYNIHICNIIIQYHSNILILYDPFNLPMELAFISLCSVVFDIDLVYFEGQDTDIS